MRIFGLSLNFVNSYLWSIHLTSAFAGRGFFMFKKLCFGRPICPERFQMAAQNGNTHLRMLNPGHRCPGTSAGGW